LSYRTIIITSKRTKTGKNKRFALSEYTSKIPVKQKRSTAGAVPLYVRENEIILRLQESLSCCSFRMPCILYVASSERHTCCTLQDLEQSFSN
jgi:hypothetical protein